MSFTILVVDDHKSIREFCRRELEKVGHRVNVAAGAAEALQLCEMDPPDLLVLDMRMPEMSASELLGQLQEDQADMPVILFTAHKHALGAEFDGKRIVACLEKTRDLEELKTTIARALSMGVPRVPE
jgi:DNA-binding NtrC family response regulator